MGLSSILGFALPISHLVCSIVFVGCLQFTANGTDCEGAAITVGYGLFMIVALQYLSVSFFTRNVRNEEPSSISKIFWFIFAGSTLLFLIVVAIWSGVTPAVRSTPRFAAAVAFSVFDFLTIIAMIVSQIFIFKSDVPGYSAPPSTVTNV